MKPKSKDYTVDETIYEPPTITEIASVHELTLTPKPVIQKHDNNTPDGYEYNGTILTS